MAKPTVKPTGPPKQKQGQPANSINKQAKKNWAAFEFYHVFRQIWIIPHLTSSAALHMITCDCTWLHVTAYHCTWLYMTSRRPSSKLLPFDFQVSCLARPSRPSSLSHKALVFLLELTLSQEVFYQRLSHQYLVNNHRFSSSVSRHQVERFIIKLQSYLYIWQSSRLREKTIVISWSRDL